MKKNLHDFFNVKTKKKSAKDQICGSPNERLSEPQRYKTFTYVSGDFFFIITSYITCRKSGAVHSVP